ncbi:alkaline phosphatase family protein [Aliikangiella marina]|uniref:Alkaline phosphatase family protein n=1 Tax=Aliikangiella marina TaxID=1712262 RepID=A0A545TJE3_9GAMM|nr:alkaline phosphatase D family protein [Aliikangiella marina]TQV77352.1 alkaline phosphatase family protein [Aliikangiella marina]
MSQLPLVLSGPILRKTTPNQVTFWLASSKSISAELSLYPESESAITIPNEQMIKGHQSLQSADSLFINLITIELSEPLPCNQWIGYDLVLVTNDSGDKLTWKDWAPELVYEGRKLPGFLLPSNVKRIMHGSCRKPHHPSEDGLVRADQWLSENDPNGWPSALIMSGDQIYTDDVSTPMLVAIHELIEKLDFPSESFMSAKVFDSSELHKFSPHYNQRETVLPVLNDDERAVKAIFKGARKPVFTSISAQNHLVSLAEVLAMYLLVWSPSCWELLDINLPQNYDETAFNPEKERLIAFRAGLKRVRRLMAHLPCAMIFDDHEITDDWNLNAAWERAAYNHPFSKRIIGNALIGYFLCQGWANAPENFDKKLIEEVQQVLKSPGDTPHEALIDDLLKFPNWHYQWNTSPLILVLDTRTHRWRSERNFNKPSGLMDWEMLSELQQKLLHKEAVILVSPAPIFGVKLIEVIQGIFTWFGKPLVVDSENWMAHPGTANTLINMFRSSKTPKNFVILSGDVHYSFVYHIECRGSKQSSNIWQITSSGIKNEFPKKLLDILDRLNRWLFSPKSPLNWFTKRRSLRVIPHKPIPSSRGERLVNASGMGLVEFNPDGSLLKVTHLNSDGKNIGFEIDEASARWE